MFWYFFYFFFQLEQIAAFHHILRHVCQAGNSFPSGALVSSAFSSLFCAPLIPLCAFSRGVKGSLIFDSSRCNSFPIKEPAGGARVFDSRRKPVFRSSLPYFATILLFFPISRLQPLFQLFQCEYGMHKIHSCIPLHVNSQSCHFAISSMNISGD